MSPNREGVRVAIDLRRGVEPETVKRQLYKFTSIETSFGFNTLAIVDNKPKTCNLKDFLDHFLQFREDVVIKKTKYDLQKAEDKSTYTYWTFSFSRKFGQSNKIIRSSKILMMQKNNFQKQSGR